LLVGGSQPDRTFSSFSSDVTPRQSALRFNPLYVGLPASFLCVLLALTLFAVLLVKMRRYRIDFRRRRKCVDEFGVGSSGNPSLVPPERREFPVLAAASTRLIDDRAPRGSLDRDETEQVLAGNNSTVAGHCVDTIACPVCLGCNCSSEGTSSVSIGSGHIGIDLDRVSDHNSGALVVDARRRQESEVTRARLCAH
jgi:hypothetical protein